MKLVVRIPLDLVGKRDSVARTGARACDKEAMYDCSDILFVPWKKNRDPSQQADAIFRKSKLIGGFVLSKFRMLRILRSIIFYDAIRLFNVDIRPLMW